MNHQKQIDYARIEKAILYICNHFRDRFRDQPSLNEIAQTVGISSSRLQQLFNDWAGVSPEKFTQYLSIGHAKHLLRQQLPLLDTAYKTGLSGSGRLHSLFIGVEGMTPGEFKSGGTNLRINFSFVASPFGKILVASTPKGICHLAFAENEQRALTHLKSRFPNADCYQIEDAHQQASMSVFREDWRHRDRVRLHLAGTPFQLKVWETLLTIPMGSLTTYGDLAKKTGTSKAARAVGSAVGKNPVAYLIPCHRVIRSNGNLGGYMWGRAKKSAIIGWEAAKTDDRTDACNDKSVTVS